MPTLFLVLLSLLVAWPSAAAQSGAVPRAELQYLQHSGWVVRTPTHILVFDYVEKTPSGAVLPDSLKLTHRSFDQRQVVVFVSHSHADHFDPTVAAWARERPDIRYVVGVSAIAIPGAKVMQPREAWASGGVAVRTTGSTDEGVGFEVTVDGITIYHAGDHARWVDAIDADFMSEIHWLKNGVSPIDIALFPIATGMTCEARPSIAQGVYAAARLLQPRILVPMHVGCADRFGLYDRFKQESGGLVGSSQVVAPAMRGERFRYSAGRMFPPGS